MDSFDIGRLTDLDFEAICKDIFEEKLGIGLEIFAPGKDGGIDLRAFANDGRALVIQCKHWMRSPRHALVSHIENHEAPKVSKLSPGRYVLATSADLTPASKRKIYKALNPYMRSEQDIYGVREIEGELRRRPHIIRRHLRLWLSSSSILQSLLMREVLLRSRDLCEEIDATLRVYVPNEAFTRAMAILEYHGVCIIAGLPGIGKTTLAQVLAANHIAAGYEIVEVSEDIEEANKAWDDSASQFFYYDDFLGQTTFLGQATQK